MVMVGALMGVLPTSYGEMTKTDILSKKHIGRLQPLTRHMSHAGSCSVKLSMICRNTDHIDSSDTWQCSVQHVLQTI